MKGKQLEYCVLDYLRDMYATDRDFSVENSLELSALFRAEPDEVLATLKHLEKEGKVGRVSDYHNNELHHEWQAIGGRVVFN